MRRVCAARFNACGANEARALGIPASNARAASARLVSNPNTARITESSGNNSVDVGLETVPWFELTPLVPSFSQTPATNPANSSTNAGTPSKSCVVAAR
jgi:hypothetical protein|tara:strand:- start:735 stop:1031 length:297 start_codon:yes stop_codon:yes gene_type:complete